MHPSATLLGIFLLLSPCTSLLAKNIPPQAFCRGGQVFMTWQEVPSAKEGYIVSRIEKAGNVEVARIPQGSGIDFVEQNAAKKHERKEEPRGFVIQPGGSPLPKGTGLWVHTVKKSGKVNYSIKTIDGSEVGCVSVTEKPGNAEPILENIHKLDDKHTIRTYIHWATPEESYIDGHPFKFVVQTDTNFKTGTKLPLYLILHAWGGTFGPDYWTQESCISVMPDDFTRGLPYDEYDWWYGYSNQLGENLKNGTVINYTERRLLHTLRWVMSQFPVDENRVYLHGSSMGGTGSMSFGMRHPEIFAAIDTNVPMVNPGMDCIGNPQKGMEKQLGKREWNLKTNEGIGVWDRQNMIKYVREHHGDLPYLKTLSGRNDTILVWPQIPPFYEALQESHHGFAGFWGHGDHGDAATGAPEEHNRFSISKIRKNESYPAVSYLSANNRLGNGSKTDGDRDGLFDAGFDWDHIVDLPARWEVVLHPMVDQVKSSTLDLTPRRLQRFQVRPGVIYHYLNLNAKTDKVIQEGVAKPDQWDVLTLEKLTIVPDGNHIIIKP